MSGNLGSGIFLDTGFDFGVSSTGDLRSESGSNELGKDLAMQMILSLEQYIGKPPTNLVERKVAATATNVALADSRVDSVDKNNIVVTFNNERSEITVEMSVFTEDSEQEFVFNV